MTEIEVICKRKGLLGRTRDLVVYDFTLSRPTKSSQVGLSNQWDKIGQNDHLKKCPNLIETQFI